MHTPTPKIIHLAILTLASAMGGTAMAGSPWTPVESGFRIGIDDEEDVDLTGAEIFAAWNTPYAWRPTETSTVSLRVETDAGVLAGDDETGAVFRAGPALAADFDALPLDVSLASAPTFLTEDEYGDAFDLGGNFHLTSSVTATYAIDAHWSVGYRFQHTSNAGLEDENPGLNMHFLSIRFAY